MYNRRDNTMEKHDKLALIIGTVLVLMTAISCATFYTIQELAAMKSNIESAIVKGIDPLAVKCAYKQGSTECALYASSHARSGVPVETKK